VNLAIWKSTKLAIVGKNGTGKSTVLKSLAGELPLRKGVRKAHPGLKIGVFSQLAGDALPLEKSALALVQERFELQEQQARSALGSCGLSEPTVRNPIRGLSGGQRARLMWTLISLQEPHILLLDEPETHLDLLTIAQLIDLLQEWEGAIVMVTHDVYMQEVCDETLELVITK
jgi:ATPase subunit of ABC transporter with duplicated ATPase domains